MKIFSNMKWTRNTIFKARCVIAEMREIGPWVDSLAMPDTDPKELKKMSRKMKRDLMEGHWKKLRSLARELPLALALDTPGLRTICKWLNNKGKQHEPKTTSKP